MGSRGKSGLRGAEGASLTPAVDFMYQWIDDPDFSSGALLLLTLGVTWD